MARGQRAHCAGRGRAGRRRAGLQRARHAAARAGRRRRRGRHVTARAAGRARVPVVRLGAGGGGVRDEVAIEEPLELRLGKRSLLVTMRTPGRDFDLVRGLLFTEGLVERPADVVALAHCRDVPREARGNVVNVGLRRGAHLREAGNLRLGLISSACGVCGKSTLQAVR
ncbi:MAG: hypothetical protein FJ296_09360, partial [Planctomycetes bacterium]|nr:hypothetical protein [Planctomycetota bacterium]